MDPHRFDYNRVDWRFVSRILDENSLRLSRTRKGISNTETSADKLPLRLTGDALRAKSAENERRVHRSLFETRQDRAPQGGDEVQTLLFQLADTTNEGLLPAGRFRIWEIGSNQSELPAGEAPITAAQAKVTAQALPTAVASFCETVYLRWEELESGDPVPLASWAEWELNGGSLHPFYDGCGRISRSFGAMLLLRGSTLLPLYDTMDAYFESGNRGHEAFCQYVRARIRDCARWLTVEKEQAGDSDRT
jgi:hypothetical protein